MSPPAAPKLEATALLPMYQLMSDFPIMNNTAVTTAPTGAEKKGGLHRVPGIQMGTDHRDTASRRPCLDREWNALAAQRVICETTHIEEFLMVDRDRVEGSLEQGKGKVKEVVGKVTGDKKTEGEGKADQVKGEIQNTIGGIKDTLKGE
jgi:uncharacterized protein YjbJ (UPF0337 family)